MKLISILFIFISFLVFMGACQQPSGVDKASEKESLVDSLEESQKTKKRKSSVDPVLVKLNEQIYKNPEVAEFYYERAKYFYEKEQHLRALKDAERLLELDSNKASHQFLFGQIAFEQGGYGRAETAWERTIELDDNHVDAYVKLGELNFYFSEYLQAFRYLNEALRIDEFNDYAYFLKGLSYKEMKDTARAISSFETALEVQPSNYDAHMQLGLLYSAQNDPKAIRYFGNAMRIKPHKVEPYYARGYYYQWRPKPDKAIADYQKALEADPNHLGSNYNLGYIYLHQKEDLDSAELYFDKVISIDYTNKHAYYRKGLIAMQRGDKANAEKHLQRALEIDGDFDLAQEALNEL